MMNQILPIKPLIKIKTMQKWYFLES